MGCAKVMVAGWALGIGDGGSGHCCVIVLLDVR